MNPQVIDYQLAAADDDAICLAQQRTGAGPLLLNGILGTAGAADTDAIAASQTFAGGVGLAVTQFTGIPRTVTLTSSDDLTVSVDSDAIADGVDVAEDEPLEIVPFNDPASPRTITLTLATEDMSDIDFTIVGLGVDGLPQQEVLAGPDDETVVSVNKYTAVFSITPNDDSAFTLDVGWIIDVYFTLHGLGVNGQPLIEKVPGFDNTTVNSANLFSAFHGAAANATVGGGAEVEIGWATFNGPATLPRQQRLSFDSAGNISSVIFTIVGKDEYGNVITEDVTGVTTTEVPTVLSYKEVTSINASATVGSNVLVGTMASGHSPPLSINLDVAPIQVSMELLISGTANATVQYTFDARFGKMNKGLAGKQPDVMGVVWASTALAGETSSDTETLDFPVTALRLLRNSGTGNVKLTVVQAGRA